MAASRTRREPDELDDEHSPAAGPRPADWASFALDALRRRKFLAAAVFLLGVGAAFGYLELKAPIYRVDAKILAQRGQALPTAIRSAFEDAPTRSAREIVHRRENLIALIRAAHLLDDEAAPPAPGADKTPGRPGPGVTEKAAGTERATDKGSATDPVSGADQPAVAPRLGDEGRDERLETWITILDRTLVVNASEGTIEMAIELRDPQLAFDIIQASVQTFLEARHVQEVEAINEVLGVLRARAATLRQELDAAIVEARRTVGVASSTRAVAARPRSASPELVRCRSNLAAKQRAIADLDDFRRRRVAELQTQLEQARRTFSERHPTIIGLRKDLENLGGESPQIAPLREEERALIEQCATLASREGLGDGGSLPPVMLPSPALERDEVENNPRVRTARLMYEQIAQKTSAAEAELDSARAAFKYRYNVVWPPQLPKDPVSPNPRKILPAALLGSLLAALAIAVLPDLLSGRIRQRWQVERGLGIQVVGEIDRKG